MMGDNFRVFFLEYETILRKYIVGRGGTVFICRISGKSETPKKMVFKEGNSKLIFQFAQNVCNHKTIL